MTAVFLRSRRSSAKADDRHRDSVAIFHSQSSILAPAPLSAGSIRSVDPNQREDRESSMSSEPNRLLRASRVLWGRLGSARIFVAGAVGVTVVLATLGIWHLASLRQSPVVPAAVTPTKPVGRVAPGIESSPTQPSPHPSPSELERAIAITDITETMKQGRHGETLVVATIAIASRTQVEKKNIEIRVFFYDLDRNGEMRPTDAEVTYEWLTPIRDWTDTAPKYLAATYLQPRPSRPLTDQLHYGGFLVRVYSDGKLQDERSKPDGLIAALHSNATRIAAAPSISPTPPPSASRPGPSEGGSPSSILTPPSSPYPPPSAADPHPSTNPSPTAAPSAQDTSLPYGKPVSGKPGFVQSPYDSKFLIDVRGFPPGTLVNDPNTSKPFRVP
jgi:hypothetical protein